jgi:GTP-binding protein
MTQEFIDEARIFVKSGKGGDGMMTFRREKFVPRGGPSGGDGGKGGDVIFFANKKLNTLRKFSGQIHFRAEDGGRGGSSKRTGASGDDLEIDVPVGTIIRDDETGRVLADLHEDGQRIVVLKGGQGGRGNVHFKSSSNQAPHIAEKGDDGSESWLRLELKVLADVGLVGMPNAGKSTLLSVISNARPRIADYPFTTLVPNLGVVRLDYRDTVVADIPGLVEGAAQGAGLGHDFLRHVQRTRLLAHLIDGASQDPVADFQQINTELAVFDERLADRPQLVLITKLDLPDAAAKYDELEKTFSEMGYPVLGISAATQHNIRQFIGTIFQMLDALPEESPSPLSEDEMPVYELAPDSNRFTVLKTDEGVFQVSGAGIERAVKRTNWYLDDAVRRFQRILEAMGITAALQKEGVEVGDTVIIGEMELEWED